MKRRLSVLVLALLVGLVAVAWAATGKPPPGLPDWLILVLAVLLPWVFQTFICKLPSILKLPVSYLLATLLAVVCGFVFLGWKNLGDIVRNLPWLWAVMQFVYELLVKTWQRHADKKRKNILRHRP